MCHIVTGKCDSIFTCVLLLFIKLAIDDDSKNETGDVLTEDQKAAINQLALSLDLPVLTATNRTWLLHNLLQHAVSFKCTFSFRRNYKLCKFDQQWTIKFDFKKYQKIKTGIRITHTNTILV